MFLDPRRTHSFRERSTALILSHCVVEIFTIGAYGASASGFFAALGAAQNDLFVDIRRRRGMRGSAYAFANSTVLQQRLAQIGIPYLHLKELAPTNAVRELQRVADAQAGVRKSSRAELSPAFINAYAQVLDAYGPERILKQLGHEVRRPVFFCVERNPAACHRSLVADAVASVVHAPVHHLFACE